MTGFDSKRQAALDKLVELTDEMGLYDKPAQERASPCARHCEAQAFKIEIRWLKAQLAQPAPPPECKTDAEQTAYAFGWWKALESMRAEFDWKDQYEKQKRRAEMWIAKYEKDIGPLEKAVPVAQEPRNFCPRCGKRTADLTVIHTCTPPRGLEMT